MGVETWGERERKEEVRGGETVSVCHCVCVCVCTKERDREKRCRELCNAN